jgi:hypothetical protein
MSAEKIEVVLDEKLQIIRQTVAGAMDENDAYHIGKQTEECAGRLKDPLKVKILCNAQALKKGSSRARKILVEYQKRSKLDKVAVWGAKTVDRVVIRFINLATGIQKTRAFENEKDALDWLMK